MNQLPRRCWIFGCNFLCADCCAGCCAKRRWLEGCERREWSLRRRAQTVRRRLAPCAPKSQAGCGEITPVPGATAACRLPRRGLREHKLARAAAHCRRTKDRFGASMIFGLTRNE